MNKDPTDATVCRYLSTAKLLSFAVDKYLHIVASVGFLFTLISRSVVCFRYITLGSARCNDKYIYIIKLHIVA